MKRFYLFSCSVFFGLFIFLCSGCSQTNTSKDNIVIKIGENKLFSFRQIAKIPKNTSSYEFIFEDDDIVECEVTDMYDVFFKGKKVGETNFYIEFYKDNGTSKKTSKRKIIVEDYSKEDEVELTDEEIRQAEEENQKKLEEAEQANKQQQEKQEREKEYEPYRGIQQISSSSLTNVFRISKVDKGYMEVSVTVDSPEEYGELWIDVKDLNGNVVLHLNDFAYPDDYNLSSRMFHFKFSDGETLEPGIYTIEITRSIADLSYNFNVTGIYY